jgi:hypothetical protein
VQCKTRFGERSGTASASRSRRDAAEMKRRKCTRAAFDSIEAAFVFLAGGLRQCVAATKGDAMRFGDAGAGSAHRTKHCGQRPSGT